MDSIYKIVSLVNEYLSDYILTIGGRFLCNGKEVPCRLLMSPDIRSLNFLLRKLGVSGG